MTWSVSIGPGFPGDEESLDGLLLEADLPVAAAEIGASCFLIAKDEGRVVGCGALQPVGSFALLRSLAVSPTHRRRGLGRTLLRELIDRALRLEVEAIYLLTLDQDVFFSRMGFRRTDRENAPDLIHETEHFRSSCCERATFMSFVFPRKPLES